MLDHQRIRIYNEQVVSTSQFIIRGRCGTMSANKKTIGVNPGENT